jgi:hypothetical protein
MLLEKLPSRTGEAGCPDKGVHASTCLIQLFKQLCRCAALRSTNLYVCQ